MASKDFFLSPDEAQTLGDINYMRKSVRVRHTFPKNLKNPNGFEIVKEVSSSQDSTLKTNKSNASIASYQPSNSNFTNQVESASLTQDDTSVSAPSPQKTVNSSMDMFRNMARNLGQK